jgi:hypothetical protein
MSDLPRRFSKSPGITDSDSHHDPHRRALLPVANLLSSILPGLGVPSPAMPGIQRSYAPWRPLDYAHRALSCKNWRIATMLAYPPFAVPRASPKLRVAGGSLGGSAVNVN